VIVLLDGEGFVAPGFSPASAQEFSSSEYSKTVGGIVAGEPPAIDLAGEKRLIDCLVALASAGTVQSAHDISDGGLAVTLAESCFASSSSLATRHSPLATSASLGASVRLDETVPAEHALFSERGARCIVSVSPANLAAVLATARQYNVEARELGKVTRDAALRIELKGHAAIDSPLDVLRDIWANSLERILAAK
jgi:phosphoribosylformylglycinamidine synthase